VNDRNAQFDGSIPATYDRCLGPVLFEPYARDLASRIAASGSGRILELACGTGILTAELSRRLPSSARLVATDLNPPMLELARDKLGAGLPIEWRQADAAALPFPDASFDAVVCQFGLMFVPDKAAAFREARRVLVHGGLFAFNVWDAWEWNPFGRIAHQTIAGFFPSNPPDFYTVPFGFHQTELLRELLVSHRFGDPALEVLTFQSSSPTADDFATGLVAGNPVVNAIRERGTAPVGAIHGALTQALRDQLGDRPVPVSLRAIVVTARAR
jgi:ubiquinone/menaquinone biosynthesis C-methylase UbiE